MTIPLLMLIPWNPPAPPAPASNPWVPESSVNLWDLAGVTDKVDSASIPLIKNAFGVSMSLTELIDRLNQFQLGTLSAGETVEIIQMGSYFARNTLKWTLAADNLDHWLIAGTLLNPAQTMDHTLIMNQEPVLGTLCDVHYDAIVAGIKSRLTAPAGTKFPASLATFTGPKGESIVVTPAESPLPAGGEETIYKESGTLTTDSHLTDLFNAVNAVDLVSQVRVKSEVLDTGGWKVTIVDWQVWFWDSYDWNLGGQSAEIPIGLFDRFPGIAPFRSTIEDALKRNSIDPAVLQAITVKDAQMSKIEDKRILVNGVAMWPKAYPIYSDGSWPFDVSTCGNDAVLTIPPP
ncbi:MAG: hypothetical protein U1F33_12540 [Alphaproteobacteria bacterium]